MSVKTFKQRILIVLLVAMIFLLTQTFLMNNVMAIVVATSPAGSGTQADPYVIANEDNLLWISTSNTLNNVFYGKYFIQTANLDISSISNWTAIGNTESNYFAGNYDGGKHTISGLNGNSSTGYYGLFGNVALGSIKNLGVINVNITSPNYTGGLVGQIQQTSGIYPIENCYTTGRITCSGSYNGGLIGWTKNTKISNCYSAVNLISGSGYSGGLIGIAQSGTIVNCFATGSVNLGNNGGLIGANYGTVNNSYYVTNVGTNGFGSNTGTATGCSQKTLSFFQNSSTNYKNTSYWNASYPWDFTNIWQIDSTGNINSGLPYLNGTVVAPAVNSVTVTPSSASVVQGGTQKLTASVNVTGGAAQTVTWTSSDSSSKVTVDGTGLVTVAADAVAGDYTITATSTVDGSKKGTSTITVTEAPAVKSVTITPSSANVVQGGTEQLTATADVVGGAAETVTWTSSDSTGKVTISSSGLVTVAADAVPGEYIITATSTVDGSKKGTSTITVTEAPAVLSNACDIVSWITPASPKVVGLVATKTMVNATTSAAISVVVSDKATWKLYSDVACTNEIATQTIDLSVGENTAYIKVTAEDGVTTKTYTVTITREVAAVVLSNACDVTSWTTPASPTVVGLVATKTVGNTTTSAAISVAVSENATWKLYSDVACTNEIANKTMNLNVGENTAYIKVTAEDGITTKTYTVTITRTIESVVLSNACDVTSWTTPASPTVVGLVATKTVGNATTSAAISVAVSENAKWKLYSDVACTNEIANKTMNLNVGANIAYVKVTAEDGVTTKTYTVTITRTVASVVLSNACDVTSWTTPASPTVVGLVATKTVGNTTTSAAISVVVSGNATWKLYSDVVCTNEIANKTISLSVGANTAYVKVTAEDGVTTKIYTVTITRTVAAVVLSNACDVTSWTIPASPTVAGLVATKTVGNATTSSVISVVVSENATWKLYSDVACTNEITNKTIALNVGANTAYVKVTAEDGTTTKIYTVIVTREVATSSGGSGGEGSTYTTTPVQTTAETTIKADVVDDKTGQSVKSVEAKVTTETNGSKTVVVKSEDVIIVKQADGTKSALTDFSKLGFSIPISRTITTTADTPQSVSVAIASDGTISVKGLANNTETKFAVTYDLGNGQKITIGTMDVKVASDGSVSLTSTLIDPYGIIIDATTGKPVTGVNVILYYANTARNIANGTIPDTVVPLPAIDGFKPNNNINPQVSDSNGAYGFLVFPTTDYYLVSTKDGYNKYISPTISVEQEIVKWDIKMTQVNSIKEVVRLAGLSRVDTALEIAKATYSGKVSNVILATSENYPDALAGSVLAYKMNAPILLVGSSDVDQEKVLAYMKENMDLSGTVYILGGTGAVSKAVEAKVIASGFSNINRIGGADRYETAAKIVDTMKIVAGTPIILVSGENYPDALSISSVAGVNQYPILLAKENEISDSIKNEISLIKPSKIYIIGLQGAISAPVEEQAAQLAAIDKTNIVRIGGENRYETSLEVAKNFNLSGTEACIATGNDFPDALAGSLYAGENNAPIILVDKALSDNEITYLQNNKFLRTTIFGGEGAVNKTIEQQLTQLLGQ